jgi:hypothetical protein
MAPPALHKDPQEYQTTTSQKKLPQFPLLLKTPPKNGDCQEDQMPIGEVYSTSKQSQWAKTLL